MVLMAGILLTLAITAFVWSDARKDYRERFDYDAVMSVESIVKYLDSQLQDIDSLKRFIEGKGSIDSATFSTFVKPILERKGIQAISWIAVVPANRRAPLEAASRYQGMAVFRITERAAGGAIVPAAKREVYYPVYYIEPLQGNEAAVGFDLGSTPKRLETLRTAIKIDRPQATSRIILVQEKERQFGFLVLVPVHLSGIHSGFISGVYRVDDMLKNAIGGLRVKCLDTVLTDLSGIPEERSLATWNLECGKNRALTLESPFFPQRTSEHPIEFAGRNWSVTVTATPQYRHKNASLAFLAVVPVGLLATLLMALYLGRVLSRQNRSLEIGRSHLNTLINTIPDLVWLKDAGGAYLSCNHRFEQFFGALESEIVGRTDYDFVDKELADSYRDHDRKAIEAGGSSVNEEWITFARDGHRELVETIKLPMYDCDGMLIGVLGVSRNITERKQMEKNLREAKVAADSANRAKSQFLANMSHEIRTPLNGILGMSQLLGMTELTQEQQEYVAALQLSGKNLLSLISDILDLSKIEAGKTALEWSEFSLRQCLNDVFMMQKPAAFEKRLALDMDIAKDIPFLLVSDQLRIKQILHNLLGNAVKFTREGNVTVTAQLLERYDSAVLIQITICDTGIGIAPENRDNIFKPFTQEDGSISRKYGGTGLGLTISRRLTELLGGTISVESTPGAGSCFTVTLPFAIGSETAISLMVPDKPMISWEGPPLRILFVEDDPINITFGTSLLRKLGHEFIAVENGRECLAALEQQGRFDLVLMDINMPFINGEEALCEIRKRELDSSLHQSVIALTAYSMRENKEQFLQAGFDGYVSKPLTASELIVEMKRVLGTVN